MRFGPFDEIDIETPIERPAHDAALGRKVPDVGALDRRRREEQGRAGGAAAPRLTIGTQPRARPRKHDLERALPRPQLESVEGPAGAPARFVERFEPVHHLSSRRIAGRLRALIYIMIARTIQSRVKGDDVARSRGSPPGASESSGVTDMSVSNGVVRQVRACVTARSPAWR